MSYTWQGTYFYNGQAFDEVEHAKALEAGLVSFIGSGLNYANGAVESGNGINGGIPFFLGRNGESQTITTNFSGSLVIKSVLSATTSKTELLEFTSVPSNTDSTKYFKIYDLANGVVTKDYRHINYIKEFKVEKTGTNTFRFVLNGYPSDEFMLPESGVHSVNGKAPDLSGNVELVASDIPNSVLTVNGELPDGSGNVVVEAGGVESVNDILPVDGNVTLTADDVGALSTAGGEMTGILTTPSGLKIKGSGAGSSNMSRVDFFESNGTTRKGYVGDANGNFNIISDTNNISLGVITGKKIIAKIGSGQHDMYHDGNIGEFTTQFETLATPNGTNTGNITLSDSVYNFESVSIQVTMGLNPIIRVHEKLPITDLTTIKMSTKPYDSNATVLYFSNLLWSHSTDGKTIFPSSGDVFVTFSRYYNGQLPEIFNEGGILKVWGHSRIYPFGTTHSVEQINGKWCKKITLPNGEEIIKELPADFHLPEQVI